MKHPIVTAIISAALVAGLAACTDDRIPPPTLDTDGVVIVASSHANVPMPVLSPGNEALLGEVLNGGLPVRVISADGTPEPVAVDIPDVTGGNPPARRASVKRVLGLIRRAVTVLPNTDESSAYGGLAVARDTAQALHLRKPVIICLACGLDTTGPLDMTEEGALRSEPADVVDYLTSSRQLVDFTGRFDQVTVHLTSLGYVAGPQAQLSARNRDGLTAIWSAVLKAGGAEVVADPSPLTGDPVTTDHTVTPVVIEPAQRPTPPAATPICTPQQFSFDGASGARFLPETDEWVDADEARAALEPLAAWLAESPTRTARIQGTTAGIRSGRSDEGIELSLRRARAAARLLVELGAATNQIVSVEGLGPNHPDYVPDRDAAGNPIPSLRTKNRKVIVTLGDQC